MNVVILGNGFGRFRQIRLSGYGFIAIVTLIAILLGGMAFLAGYWYSAENGSGVSRYKIADLNTAFQSERVGIVENRQHTEDTLEALSEQVGQMNARVIVLDGVARRLVEISDLTQDEFDFDSARGVDVMTDQTYIAGSSRTSEILVAMEGLNHQLDQHEAQLDALESMLLNQTLSARIYPQGRPVRSGWMSSYFGRRTDPITGKPAIHLGVDFAGKLGDEIIAVADGVVTWSSERYGFGNLVEIDHGNGYSTRYAHNDKNLVKVAEEVKKGQKIALMGDTGRSSGTNLHFEVLRNGERINPVTFIRRSAD